MEKKTIGIIFGGKSSEYAISLESAYSIIQHLHFSKYNLYLIGITKSGKWYHYNLDSKYIIDDTWWTYPLNEVIISPNPTNQGIIEIQNNRTYYQHIDAFFPILHGKNGEDGTIQGLIKLSQIPLIGCDIASSSLCMDKDRAHKIVQHAGIKVPHSIVLYHHDDFHRKQNEIQKLKYPLFIKPMKAGSSLGITKVDSYKNLQKAIDYAFTFDSEVIIEEEIKGFEVGCAIIGTDKLITGRVDEIELSQGFFDYTEKYTLKSSKIHMPARISKNAEITIQETAKTIYKSLGCNIFARVDMFLTPEGEIIFNEVNTIPGFTDHSRFPNMMKGLGLTFESLLDNLIELGINYENN